MYELSCSDFEAFSRAIQGADSRVMLAGPEESGWWLRAVDLPRLAVQVAQEGAPNVFEGASWPNAVNLLALDGAPFNLNGVAFGRETIGVLGAGQAFTTLAAGCNIWTSVSIPQTVFDETFTESPRVRGAAAATLHVHAEPVHVRRLTRSIERVVINAQRGAFDDPRAAEAAEHEVLYAARLACGHGKQNERGERGGRPAISRDAVIARALEWIRGHHNEPVHIPALSLAAGVSERTLRSTFVEWFGMGPLTYLRTRQVHQIHEALVTADPWHTTVTSVATSLGVWDQEAMTARYKSVFGETPIVTLRRSRGQRRATADVLSS